MKFLKSCGNRNRKSIQIIITENNVILFGKRALDYMRVNMYCKPKFVFMNFALILFCRAIERVYVSLNSGLFIKLDLNETRLFHVTIRSF